MSKSEKKAVNRFEIGKHGGCEAKLYEFCEKSPINVKPDDPGASSLSKPHTVRIAANTFDEAFEYLCWRQPEFEIDSVQNQEIILLISGSPVD